MRILFSLIFVCFFGTLLSQKRPPEKITQILFVFDASRSMMTKHQGGSRMEGAKELFFRFIDSLGKNRNMLFALRMYGHTVKYPPGDCKDSRLVVPFSK